MSIQTETDRLLNKYKIRAKKRFGQNFLIDENVLDQIIIAANINNEDVVEIGPGLGNLTKKILPQVNSLIAYEIDRDMIHVLKSEITSQKLNIIEKNFLTEEFTWTGKKKIIANVGTKHYGKLTISVNYFAEVRKNFIVKAESFVPVPKVDSAIISLKFNRNQEINPRDFLLFVKNCFAARRKTLANNLKQFINNQDIAILVKTISNNLLIRPQELKLEDYINLYKSCYF